MMPVKDKRDAPRLWSTTSTLILVAFVVIGILEAGAHQASGAVVCFALAVIYPPLRVLRGRLASRRGHGDTENHEDAEDHGDYADGDHR